VTGRHSVGIVVVSHSAGLAEAAVALAGQMLHGQHVAIAVAAGLEDGSLGTSVVRIRTALEQVDGPAGVVVLMDLGSALLSAELALELLADPSARERVILSPAPLVEGLVVAAVAAAGGADRYEVAAEAAGALTAKTVQLGGPVPPSVGVNGGAATETGNFRRQPNVAGDDISAVLTVRNEHGLHARPAARLVAAVTALDARVQLRNLTTGTGPVPAGSLSRVATLAALQDHRIEVRATGPQAQQAVDRVLALAEHRFDEAPAAPGGTAAGPPAGTSTGPLPASPGIAVGAARRVADAPAGAEAEPAHPAADATSRLQRVVGAVAEVRGEIDELRRRTLQELGAQEASIFDAHLALLADPDLLADVESRLGAGAGAVQAWTAALHEIEQQWAQLADPYLSARAADVHAVAAQVVRALTGAAAPRISGEGVLVARDLGPAETAGLDPRLVRGVVLTQGSPSSHAAILARARGIPMVVAAGDQVLTLSEGTPLALDGGTGELHVDPGPDVLELFERRAEQLAQRRAQDLAEAATPASTLDGEQVHVLANLGSAADATAAAAAGAEGAGLVRTEFLFLGRTAAPSSQAQEREYTAIAEAMPGCRITLRTLDVGGDKPLPYVPVPAEQNPYLGLRGVRLTLDRPELLTEQLAAICRTGRSHPVNVMFPMVSTVDELLAARQLLVEAAGGAGLPPGLRVGMMVEVPAAALKIEHFLPHLDFVSIGTNDLTQYTVAAERGNPSVASLCDALDPAVLRLVAQVCRAAQGRVDVAVCGEAASDECAVPVLVGLGVRELSVTPHAVPTVKAALRGLHAGTCRDLADAALRLPGPQEVRALVRSTLAGVLP